MYVKAFKNFICMGRFIPFKFRVPPSKKVVIIYFNENPFEVMKNALYFTSRSLSNLKVL